MQRRPILLNSCARAATTAEARFRIDVPIAPSRATRVVALDDHAEVVVRGASTGEWNAARFYRSDVSADDADADLGLRTMAGPTVPLQGELEGIDAMIMVASSVDGADAAATIGAACTVRGIMTAGLVLTDGLGIGPTLTALRPHARVLLVPADEDDLAELLRAIRA